MGKGVSEKLSLKRLDLGSKGELDGGKLGAENKGGPDKKTKEALKKVPKKQRIRTVFSVLLMLVWVGASVIVAQLLVGYLMVFILGKNTFSEPVPTAIYSALSYILALVMIVFIPPRVMVKWKIVNREGDTKKGNSSLKTDLTEIGLKDWPTWTDIGLAPVGYIVSLLLSAGLVALFSLFPWFDAEQVQEVGFSYYISGMDRVIAFFTLVVVAPIAEELIFRGWLYGKLREKLSRETSNIASIILSSFLVSLLFGVVHLQWNVGVNVFATSLVLCALREITGTIYAGTLAHMLKNGIAFYLLYVVGVM